MESQKEGISDYSKKSLPNSEGVKNSPKNLQATIQDTSHPEP